MLDATLFHKSSMTLEQKEQVVRLLTQSPCLPFLNDKKVSIERQPGFFLKIDQDVIRIGSGYSDGPVGMVLLRYALEWHIWHGDVANAVAAVVCDLAAARVTSLFLSFFSKTDQRAIYRCLPSELIETLKWARGTLLTVGACDQPHLTYLASLRSVDRSARLPTVVELEIVNALAASTEHHFTQGGDTRIHIDEDTRLNVYGCLPFPRNNAFTFASSTSTTVSSYAYAESEKRRQQIIRSCIDSKSLKPLAQSAQEIKGRLLDIFDLRSTGCEVLISPSGTDSQLHAVVITSTVLQTPLVSIVTGSDEAASGTPFSGSGQHFYDATCLGIAVNKGERLAGLPDIESQSLPLRDNVGRVRAKNEMDATVWEAVSDYVNRGYGVLLHAMDQSKHGRYSPSAELLERIQSKFGQSVQVIIDACQGRIDSADIRRFLGEGWIVLLTGSKFYTGPPFSGAALFPRSLCERIDTGDKSFPAALADYIPRSDLGNWRSRLPNAREHNNIGMHLRWWAGLAEAARYREVPEDLRCLALDLFCQRAERILREAPFIELVFAHGDEQYAKSECYGTELSCRRTILPFHILCEKKYLNPEQTKAVYALLNRDISSFVAGTAEELRLAARCCHIGQPVKTRFANGTISATLRISAGARIVSESWIYRDAGMFFKKVEEEINQIEFIVQKIGLIINKGLHNRAYSESGTSSRAYHGG